MSRVLVLGSAQVGKKHIVEAVVAAGGAQDAAEWAKADDHAVLAHTLVTKYYSAPIAFHVPEAAHDVPEDLSPYEGLLLVWDATQKASWSHAQSVLVAVANRASPDMVLENMNDCCLEHGFEHIAVSRGASSAAAGSETSGIDRLVEALQCNMWTSMEMRDGVRHPTAESAPAAAPKAPTTPHPTPASTPSLLEQDEGFEALLQEVLSIREDVNLQRLTDDERRARAADMAMKLMSLLGDNSDDDESSDDE
ncbi:hypothetical protein SPRG_13315 [Saprolegnia parasitica CBS 223.65]|uniref:Uncharacterized protein n=1 Tax=Saprolegnia parasitica (strain CBS 223.65) TaxID=695850 RepID=A0A067BR75_SAPPC|nr:hypothetical protein SPRG_13315 [Saprolegnia parasitica CBS 223.65]KDO20733.1 hypothetical protein SPRG_13315 [Saprolegnia parasitica CBS 223.65]|eukprot:XP_012208545.1 hypothetical protein SPRG_13315 [Saprolegnia parasitica CBS 223.65]